MTTVDPPQLAKAKRAAQLKIQDLRRQSAQTREAISKVDPYLAAEYAAALAVFAKSVDVIDELVMPVVGLFGDVPIYELPFEILPAQEKGGRNTP